MGLFDKKYCDVCSEKIGLLGNRKLEDGNLCKHCARKLSPFFSERRSSTVEEIKQQLAYREENKAKLPSFHPTKTYGFSDKVYVDMNGCKFIVTSDDNWRGENPDIIDFSQVLGVSTDVEEEAEELFYRDNDGNEKSYNPPRYKYEYKFNVIINIDSPWFTEIEFELSSYNNRPDSRYSPLYRELEMMSQELVAVLTGAQMPQNYTQSVPVYSQPQYPASAPQQTQSGGMWVCGNCSVQNTSRFCQNCGAPQPVQQSMGAVRCDKCGWVPQPGAQPPRFCPQCGDPIDFKDRM